MMRLLQKSLPFMTNVARFVLSSVFLSSGFVKAADPMGMMLKVEAYFAAWGLYLPYDSGLVWFLVIALSTVEFMLGMYLLLGIRSRFASWCTLFMMMGMTALTVYVFAYDPVPDCGCFGDVIVLSNTDTLLKNVVLLVLAFVLLLRRNDVSRFRFISERNQWLTSLYSIVYVIVLSLYTSHYLPVVDFTPYGIGTGIREAVSGEYTTRFVYEKNGVRETFDEENLPDSTWHFVDSDTRVIKEPRIADFSLFSLSGEDITTHVLEDTGYVFLLTLPSEPHADAGCNDRINDIYDFSVDKGMSFYCATTASQAEIDFWKDRTGAAYPFVSAGAATLKAMVRSNPGLMLLKNGRIIAKWSNNNLPDEKDLQMIATLTAEAQLATLRRAYMRQLLWFIIPLLLLVLLDRIWIGSKYYKRYYIRKTLKIKTMRKKIVAGNWKMNKNLQEGVALAKELNEILTAERPNCDVVICTPFIHLASVAAELNSEVIGLGAENCADKASGAYTGEVSAEMVKSTGAQYVILGHSERREYYHETPEILKEKVELALAQDLKVIFCIGESLQQREANEQNAVVKAELEGSVFHLSAEDFASIIIAYEPIWAIGTGKTATAEQAEEIHAYIRSCVAEKYGEEVADNTSILYGGSCKASNAPELFAKPDIDGGLIGGASLKAPDFKGIIDAWK